MADEAPPPAKRKRGNPNWKKGAGMAPGIAPRDPGKGDGWGGPANGAGSMETKAGPEHLTVGAPSPEMIERKRIREMNKEARAEELSVHLTFLALNADNQQTQATATVAALNRYEGMPVARIATLAVDNLSKLSDEDLDALAAIGEKLQSDV